MPVPEPYSVYVDCLLSFLSFPFPPEEPAVYRKDSPHHSFPLPLIYLSITRNRNSRYVKHDSRQIILSLESELFRCGHDPLPAGAPCRPRHHQCSTRLFFAATSLTQLLYQEPPCLPPSFLNSDLFFQPSSHRLLPPIPQYPICSIFPFPGCVCSTHRTGAFLTSTSPLNRSGHYCDRRTRSVYSLLSTYSKAIGVDPTQFSIGRSWVLIIRKYLCRARDHLQIWHQSFQYPRRGTMTRSMTFCTKR